MSTITADTISQELDELLEWIQRLSNSNDPEEKNKSSHEILGGLLGTIGKLNYLMKNKMEGLNQPMIAGDETAILQNLGEWVLKIRQALEQLAKFLLASSYTIGVAVPLGVQVSITFTP